MATYQGYGKQMAGWLLKPKYRNWHGIKKKKKKRNAKHTTQQSAAQDHLKLMDDDKKKMQMHNGSCTLNKLTEVKNKFQF